MEIGFVSAISNRNNINSFHRGIGQRQAQSNTESNNPVQETETSQKNESTPSYTGNENDLVEAPKRDIEQLKKLDSAVRSHELAHISAGGRFVRGGARFQYQTGPDGKRYAVGGEVSIDSSPVPGDPQATAEKMDKIRAAALAPMDPSSQDQRVATMASRIKAEALMELSLLQVKHKTASDPKMSNTLFSTAATSYENSQKDIPVESTIDIML